MNILKPALLIFTLATISSMAFARPPIERIIERLDVDDDGLISQDEFQPPGRERAKRLDINKDGAISSNELITHQQEMTQRQQERHEKMLQHFESADTDGDGLVTAEEARLAAFARADENGDGYLDATELKEARPRGPRHAYRQQRGQHHQGPGNAGDQETI